MIKKLFLFLLLSIPCLAHIPRFPLEQQAIELYLDVEPNCNRIYFQKLVYEYLLWLESTVELHKTNVDREYIERISYIMKNLVISYVKGVQ